MASSNEPKKRRRKIILADVSGEPVPDLEMNVTGIANANSQACFTIVVMQQCDLLHWHSVDALVVPPWGSD